MSCSRWGQAGPNLPQHTCTWRKILMNLILQDYFSTRRDRVWAHGPGRAPELSQRRPETACWDLFLCRETQPGVANAGAVQGLEEMRRQWGLISPLIRQPPGLSLPRCWEPALLRHRLCLHPGLLGPGGGGCMPEPAGSCCRCSSSTRNRQGRIDSSSLSLTEHQLSRSRRKQGF